MPAVHVDRDKVHEFVDMDAFYGWLAKHHASEREVWIKIHKAKSGLLSITPEQAIHAALCWGWIDGNRKSFAYKADVEDSSLGLLWSTGDLVGLLDIDGIDGLVTDVWAGTVCLID